MKRETALTSPDVLALLRELQVLENGIIEKFWSNPNRTAFLMRVKKQREKYLVLMEPGVRINLTRTSEEQWVADGFAMNIRAHISDRRIRRIYQHEFDRIIIFEIEPDYKLVIEMLSRGFLVLVKGDQILFANKYVEMRDRKIKPGAQFKFPPNPPKDPRRMSFEEFKEKLLSSKDVVRGLVRLGLGSKYSEEICFRCNINKNKPVSELSDEEIQKLFAMTCKLLDEIEKENLSPRIYYDNEECFVVSPIELKSLKFPYRNFPTFSDAVDIFFAEVRKRKILEELKKYYEAKKKELLKKIKSQEDLLKEYQEKVEKYQKIASKIYENLELLENILTAIRNARKKNLSWDEINQKIAEGKQKGHKIAQMIERVTKDGKIYVVIDDVRIPLDIRKTTIELANDYFEKAKKLKKKIERIREEITKSQKELEKLEKEFQDALKKHKLLMKYTIRRSKKKWYESYHWFISSDGFLVVAGKDAQSNEALVKKHMSNGDIFVHVDIPGGAVVLIKNPEKKEIPRTTIIEAAKFAAIYSKAWKEQMPAVEVFWTTLENVSKSPPPGHYLPTGSFIIKEKKEIITIDKMELAIGIQINKKENEAEFKLVMGPPEVIRKQTHLYVVIKPGKLQRSQIAKLILEKLKEKCKNEIERAVVNAIKVEEILDHIPGNSEIME